MSLERKAFQFLEFVLPSDVERFVREHPVMAAAHTPLSVVAGVVVGALVAGTPVTDILICAPLAGGGVALFCAGAAWLFDVPIGPGLFGLSDDSGRLRPLRFGRSRNLGHPTAARANPRLVRRSPPQDEGVPVGVPLRDDPGAE
jgi:hypothetical protein